MEFRRGRTTAENGPILIVAGVGGFCSPFVVHALGMGGTAWRWPAAVVVGVILAGISWLVIRWRDRASRRRGHLISGIARDDRSSPSRHAPPEGR